MMVRESFCVAFTMACALTFGVASAATDPYTETFDANTAGWFTGGFTPTAYVAAGGNPDGHITASAEIEDNGQAVAFRTLPGASGNEFFGDWEAGGITQVSFDIKHDHFAPLTFFIRIAVPVNFPAHNAVSFLPVLPNTWTTVTFDVSPGVTPPLLISESGDYSTTFSNVGALQIGTDDGPVGNRVAANFYLDNVSINTPEPTSVALLSLGGLVLARRGRRGRRD